MTDRQRIGVDLGGTKIAAVRMDGAGRIGHERRIATPAGDYTQTLAAVADLVDVLDPEGTVPVGVGTPGAWQPDLGVMKNCNSTWLNGRRLLPDLRHALERPVRIANDADCFALSEAVDGAGAGAPSVFGVILGTGVGGGVVVDGRLLCGPNGLTGEWGHVPMPYLRNDPRSPGPQADLEARLPVRHCYCGRTDCIETYLSGPGLSAMHATLHGATLDAIAIARAPDADAAATRTLYQRLLARSLAQIVNVLDPHVIVLGGGVSQAGFVYEGIENLIDEYVFSGGCRTPVLAATHGAAGGVRGAAWLWGDVPGGTDNH